VPYTYATQKLEINPKTIKSCPNNLRTRKIFFAIYLELEGYGKPNTIVRSMSMATSSTAFQRWRHTVLATLSVIISNGPIN